MKLLVIYNSVFGNTKELAEAMAEACAVDHAVTVLRYNQVNTGHFAGLDGVIVASPTRAFSPTPEIKKYLSALPAGCLKGVKALAFDTRANLEVVNNKFLTFMVGIFGYAAKPLAKILVRKGAVMAAEPEGFFVDDKEGPLSEGEKARAVAWVKQLLG